MATLIAAIASGLTAIVLISISACGGGTRLWIVFVGVISAFVAVYSVTLYLLNRFIFEKINPIYKTIHSLNLPFKQFKKQLNSRDFVSEIYRDVQYWAEEKSQEIDRLKEMENYRKEFLGNVSHELKTPIFNIQGYVLTLLDGALNEPEINRQYLEKTEKSINRLISIVEDLESISKLETKTLNLNFEKFNIVRLVDEIFETQEIRANKRGIKLLFDKEYDRALQVYADRKRIFQALSNLIVNSIVYGKEGGKTVVSFLDLDENVLIEVRDNGIGIARKDIPRIFERFYRADKSRSREQGGTGLGLAIVKHIIEAHQQTISVRSTPNEGTSFIFTLKKYKA
ncbi:MAG: ATP-binding protein [Tenuifilaceae bacterium]|jgi:two-component system phosphate regulon sensor histidine kinase PhoR|nr:ATP-binding protein [Bacteroidales bacterium]MDI9516092.1 ATP-binding protein [Bacteroidota bacterium]HNV81305.1 ATP-binding protein [Tenuifilaceae bacterium]MZP82661.1 sensor histidine kinase [Bacteroidales bacterium]HOF91417.1 ATP-binding protein [Tenuifilaceae bacterium]